ncbi:MULTISPECIES: Panacea domain-containing protein [Campylobacter]|uniref:Panacea domain-containing protein n=1 Tax=Campylobacter TaxID=194 RepID=UPI000A33B51D|nr:MULTISPECIES: type II toxin-antitoxin system antitoxin SocA domain-containing protein [unclassified Campylobacter]MBO5063468.1 DUF4065 domain-containing protein [Campylobacter sp.]
MKAFDVAAYIINLCIEKGSPVSNLQLQKILYFTHLFYLKKTGTKLITDKPFEAWQFGPVIEDVYYKYSIFAAAPIIFKEKSHEITFEVDVPNIDTLIVNLSNKPPSYLVKLSHIKNGAWDKTYRGGFGNHTIIDDELIKEEAFINSER